MSFWNHPQIQNIVTLDIISFDKCSHQYQNNIAFTFISLQCPEPVWDKIFEVNVKNALQLSQLVVPHMQKQKGGAIVYVSSIAGFHPMTVSIFCEIFLHSLIASHVYIY